MSVKSATLKRLMKERQLMEASPCREFVAEMLEDNALEWHFTIAGPEGTPYEKGYYHGKILVPPDYPFKPPDVVLLTPNGRFELDKRICLSISSYHPENWHPTWGISTVLHALREFMSTPGNNAIGAIEYPKAVREDLAAKSVHFCCHSCGCRVEDIKDKMLEYPPATANDKEKRVEMTTPKLGPSTPSPLTSPVPASPLREASLEQNMEGRVLLPSPCRETTPQTEESKESTSEVLAPVKEEMAANGDSTMQEAEAPTSPALAPLPQTAAAAAGPPTPTTPPVVRPPLPAPRLFETRNGEVVVNLSIATIDRTIHVLLVVIALILCKKAFYDYWELIARFTSSLLS